MAAFICYSGAEWGGGPFYQEKPKENNNSRHKSTEESQAQEKNLLVSSTTWTKVGVVSFAEILSPTISPKVIKKLGEEFCKVAPDELLAGTLDTPKKRFKSQAMMLGKATTKMTSRMGPKSLGDM